MTHTPCVAFGAFPFQGDDACGRRSTASAGLACFAALRLFELRGLRVTRSPIDNRHADARIQSKIG